MDLYVGGRCQGKLEYVLAKQGQDVKQGQDTRIADGAEYPLERPEKVDILNHFHLLIRRLMEQGRDIGGYVQEILAKNPKLVIICDEVGMGIVPTDAGERRYREEVGRCCCMLAKEAWHVERIVCGRGMVLK